MGVGEIAEFAAATRYLGTQGGWRRRVLGIRFQDGTVRWLTELNTRPSALFLDDAATTFNYKLAAILQPDHAGNGGNLPTGEDHEAHAAGTVCGRCGQEIAAGQDARRRTSGEWVHDICPVKPPTGTAIQPVPRI